MMLKELIEVRKNKKWFFNLEDDFFGNQENDLRCRYDNEILCEAERMAGYNYSQRQLANS